MCFLNIFINILMNLEEQNSKSTDAFDECLKSFKKVKKEVYPLKDTQKTVSFINVHKQTKFSLQNNKSVINFSRSLYQMNKTQPVFPKFSNTLGNFYSRANNTYKIFQKPKTEEKIKEKPEKIVINDEKPNRFNENFARLSQKESIIFNQVKSLNQIKLKKVDLSAEINKKIRIIKENNLKETKIEKTEDYHKPKVYQKPEIQETVIKNFKEINEEKSEEETKNCEINEKNKKEGYKGKLKKIYKEKELNEEKGIINVNLEKTISKRKQLKEQIRLWKGSKGEIIY